MSQFIQLIKNITPGSPFLPKKEGRFKKFNRNSTKSISGLDSGSTSNLSKRRSLSTSALTEVKEDSYEDAFDDRRSSQISQISSSSSISNINNTNETESKTPITVKELIEKMMTHLQIYERKNEILTQHIQQLSQEKLTLETELSSTKVELNLYQNRLEQLEQTANEWHCSICMDNKETIIKSKRLLVTTFCGHVFCSSCAQSLSSPTRQSKYCPTCRKPLKDGLNYHPIFI